VLDAGSGSGIVALAIASRVEGVRVTGIELAEDMCRLARLNAQRNGLAARADFHCGDLTAPRAALFAAGLAPDSFDHAVANPPFLAAGEARLPPDPALRRAHAQSAEELDGWIKCLATFVRPGGSVTLVHRADAMPKLLAHMQRRFGGLAIFPLFPREGAAATRILIQGRKGSRAPLRLLPGMVLHGAGNSFAAEAEPILRHGAALELGGRK
jgi:tRNA1(Val) A37 N6-methylase TrmN6